MHKWMCQEATVWSFIASPRGFWEMDDARVKSDTVLSAVTRSMDLSVRDLLSWKRTHALHIQHLCDYGTLQKLQWLHESNKTGEDAIRIRNCSIKKNEEGISTHYIFFRGIVRRLSRTWHLPVALKCRFEHISIRYSLFSHSPVGFDTSLNVSMDRTHSSSWENKQPFFV